MNFSIIDSTLREGEQFINGNFSIDQKINIIKLLNDFGVEYAELSNPISNQKSFEDSKSIVKYVNNNNLKIKILTHIRCCMSDAKFAIETNCNGIDILFGTSSVHREFSHGKDIDYIIESAKKVIEYIQQQSIILNKKILIRFSSEDSFRSELEDLKKVYNNVCEFGVNRIGIADTVGSADPFQVYELIRNIKKNIPENVEIEFHGHNDGNCAVANSFAALKAGATHVDTSILGIGERNGITSLNGFIARMYLSYPTEVKKKYNLKKLLKLDSYIAGICKLNELSENGIPFNESITGSCNFNHKAGIHSKAVLNNPKTYESIDPENFGRKRNIIISSITGWNTIKSILEKHGYVRTDNQIKEITKKIKNYCANENRNINEHEVLSLFIKE